MIQGLGLRVWGLVFGAWGLGFRVKGWKLRVEGLGFRVWGHALGFGEEGGSIAKSWTCFSVLMSLQDRKSSDLE